MVYCSAVPRINSRSATYMSQNITQVLSGELDVTVVFVTLLSEGAYLAKRLKTYGLSVFIESEHISAAVF